MKNRTKVEKVAQFNEVCYRGLRAVFILVMFDIYIKSKKSEWLTDWKLHVLPSILEEEEQKITLALNMDRLKNH